MSSPTAPSPDSASSRLPDAPPRRSAAPFPMPAPYVQDLLDGAWDVFAVLEETGRIRYVSPANQRVLGYAPQEMIGRNGFDFVHPEDRAALQDTIDALRAEPNRTATLTHRFRAADGQWRTLETTIQNQLAHPTIRGLVVHSRDVTDRHALHAELTRARQQLRRLQLHPHFVLNVLHTIQMQMLDDPEAAADTISHFGDLLRLSYAHVETPMAPLGHEVDFVERYVDLYRLRFPDRITATFDVPDALRSVSVPSLLLQPIVENALRHGLLPRNGGRLRVTARVDAGALRLTVTDDGVGLRAPDAEMSEGVGVSATRDRLRQIYGRAASLTLAPAPDGGTLATITLPLDAA